jgi:hypothetical protein
MADLSPAELGRRLGVIPGDLVTNQARGTQPMAGTFSCVDGRVRFTPRFPFVDGLEYALIVESPSDGDVWSIRRPERAGAATTSVVTLYPSADAVPLNLLKIYVAFSAPMSEGWASGGVTVRRADTDELLSDVFVPGPELWDPHRRRLTLLLDPGRIKRGLARHDDAGYPLIEGVPIVVRVDPAFRDANRRPLREAAERRYWVGPALRERVDPARWRLTPPAAGSTAPLAVHFDRPLDGALLEHTLSVSDEGGAVLPGSISIGDGERSWSFVPQPPWLGGRYVLHVDPRLEDLAGNSLVRVFDRDLSRPEDAPADGNDFTIPFSCEARQPRAVSAPT